MFVRVDKSRWSINQFPIHLHPPLSQPTFTSFHSPVILCQSLVWHYFSLVCDLWCCSYLKCDTIFSFTNRFLRMASMSGIWGKCRTFQDKWTKQYFLLALQTSLYIWYVKSLFLYWKSLKLQDMILRMYLHLKKFMDSFAKINCLS